MTWYLSAKNREALLPFIKQLRENQSQSEIKLTTKSPSRLMYMLQNGRHTVYPELKDWTFRQKHDHVLARSSNIASDISEETEETSQSPIITEPSSYSDIANHIISNKPDIVTFTNPALSNEEIEKLTRLCTNLNYSKISINDNQLTIKR